MAPELRASVLRYYRTVDTGAPEDVVALFATDAVYRRPGYAPLVGSEELLAFYAGRRVIASGRHTVDRLLVDADTAAVQGSFRGILRDGEAVALRFADFFRIDEGGLIAQRDTYFDAPLV